MPEACITSLEGLGLALLPIPFVGGQCVDYFVEEDIPLGLTCIAKYLHDETPDGSSTTYASSSVTCICDLIEDIPGLPLNVKEEIEKACKLAFEAKPATTLAPVPVPAPVPATTIATSPSIDATEVEEKFSTTPAPAQTPASAPSTAPSVTGIKEGYIRLQYY